MKSNIDYFVKDGKHKLATILLETQATDKRYKNAVGFFNMGAGGV